MAESGLTLIQIKSITGHSSDTVVQGYVENTARLRRTSSEALQFGDDTNPTSRQRLELPTNNVNPAPSDIAAPFLAGPPAMHIHINFNGANISAPVTIGSLPIGVNPLP